MIYPFVSVVSATWQRADLLLSRCVPSVRDQAYPDSEHVIVSDGPDLALSSAISALGEPPIRFAEMSAHDPASHFGHRARMRGLELARADFIAYIDDDDAWRPDHLATAMAALLAEPDAGFVLTCAMLHRPPHPAVRIGDGPLAQGRCLPSCCMVHRRELLDIATWQDEPGAPDWELVRRWHEAGVKHVRANIVTADYYPGSTDFTDAVPVSYRTPVRP